MFSIWYYTPAAVLALFLIRKYRERQWKNCQNNVSLKGKVAVITGANSGIGFEVAKELAKRHATVILACRDVEKTAEAVKKLQALVGDSGELIPMHLNLASLKSVKEFADELSKTVNKIDILINNAGVSFPKNQYKTTEDGLEIHFGVNHLGHFFLTELLLPQLKAASPSRVVVVSSTLHQRGNIYLDDLNELNRKGKTPSYHNSKLANAYFVQELAKKVKKFKINTYAVCPGWVYTSLFRNYIKWYHYILVAPVALFFMRSPRQGAQTVVYCATEPHLENETGLFYKNCCRFNSKVNFDPEIGEKFWDVSENIINDKLKVL